MKTVFVLLDRLNRNAWECHGSASVMTPNFARFAERAVTPVSHYVGSLPRIPARRDLATDPRQDIPIVAPDIEARLLEELTRHRHEADAPHEPYARFDLGEAAENA